MKCSECDSNMIQETVGSVTIDRCEVCGGLWFDPSEIGQYLQTLNPKLESVPQDSEFITTTKGQAGSCPACERKTLEVGSYRGVSFLRCGWCAGMFLDASQLRHLLGDSPETTTSLSRIRPGDVVDGLFEFVMMLVDPRRMWRF